MEDAYYDIFEDNTTLKQPLELIKEEPKCEVRDEFFVNGTRHEAVIPFGTSYEDLPRIPKCDAKTYKFELDTFQQLSLCAIERDESIMVSAHTSCGKTVVAEYAIAQSMKNSQRVIYTSPIKALSNQKYRELCEEFKDVGLMTGDVTINPTATCLVMTTEILRNMLYRGSEVIREVHWIIFDEIHYMRDRERGVVWEETIILMPKHARMVFLSATIPNALEFTEWICSTTQQAVHVVYTEKRVIPLIHYFYSDDLYLVKDSKLRIKGFNDAMRNPVKRVDVSKSIANLLERVNVPAVVFSFSRKDCENYAIKVKKDFLNEEEKETVKLIFNNAIGSLRKEDQDLPLIQSILPLLQRGIGIHHSGLLPIIKEIVEILFQESLIKVLFATETFSIGLNMPAKTVIFTALRKFDGTSRRLLTSGEYIQMSGRAGRRGLDEQGICISLVTEVLSMPSVKLMFSACSDKLNSAFRLTYNMVLNLLRVEDLDPLFVLSRSFFHYQAYRSALIEQNKLYESLNGIKQLSGADNSEFIVENYALLTKREGFLVARAQALSATYRDYIQQRGRVVDILIPRHGLPLIVKNCIVKSVTCGSRADYVSVFVLTNKDIEIKEYKLEQVCDVYDFRAKPEIKSFAKRFKKMEYKDEINSEILSVDEEIKQRIPGIDFENCLICKNQPRKCLVECELKNSANQNRVLDQTVACAQKAIEEEAVQEKLATLNKLKEVYHMSECRKMINILKRLEHIDETSVLLKGKMASEISTGDELVITEMIFNSSFNELSLPNMIALLSCTICEEHSNEGVVLSEENEQCFKILRSSVEKVCEAMNGCGINAVVEDYLENFSYELMDVVKLWMGGSTFVEICETTSAFEGSIIRTFKRLEELLRQLTDAAQVIGNTELVNLFGQGIFLIKRDIVFANS
ncbi:ATP-dependent RNA helicase DOB1, partial [Enteropsectra breve]